MIGQKEANITHDQALTPGPGPVYSTSLKKALLLR